MKRDLRGVIVGLVLTVSIVMMSVGCATSVTMRYMVPAEINMAEYKNLAVVSAEPFRFTAFSSPSTTIQDLSGTSPYTVFSGFGSNTEREIAKYLTTRIVRDLTRADYFNMLIPPTSDEVGMQYAKFKQMGYDGLLQVRVTDLDVDEYIFAKEETEILPPEVEGGEPISQKVLHHHVMQKIAITVEFVVKDTATGESVVVRSFSDAKENSYRIDPDSSSTISASSLYDWIRPMIDRFSDDFSKMVAPRWTTRSVALMANKPENPRVETSYLEAKEGSLQVALDGFLAEWRNSKHVPSGYNAAIILESFGQIEQALELIDEVWRYSGNPTVESRKIQMREAWESHKKAQQQL